MKHILAIFRSVFVSFEFLVCVAGLSIYGLLPEQFMWLGIKISEQAELMKYFGFLPIGLVVYDLKIVKSILMPDSDKRNAFQRWEHYGDFKLGCFVGLFYAVFFAIGGIVSFFFDWKTPNSHSAALLITSMVGALTVAASLYCAHIKIEVLFRQHSDPSL